VTLPLAHATCHHTTYLLTCDVYEELVTRSGGRCERCSRPAASGRLVIDHDHQLGSMAVRGLVCRGCNVILGHVDTGRQQADPATTAYLKRAFFLSLATFRVYLGPGIHPDVAAALPRVQHAQSRYVRRYQAS
jgi:hypothetical protein